LLRRRCSDRWTDALSLDSSCSTNVSFKRGLFRSAFPHRVAPQPSCSGHAKQENAAGASGYKPTLGTRQAMSQKGGIPTLRRSRSNGKNAQIAVIGLNVGYARAGHDPRSLRPSAEGLRSRALRDLMKKSR
jgi:hypothetical protein